MHVRNGDHTVDQSRALVWHRKASSAHHSECAAAQLEESKEMIERPDRAFDNPYDDDEVLCDDCGQPLYEVEDEDGKRLHCESCD